MRRPSKAPSVLCYALAALTLASLLFLRGRGIDLPTIQLAVLIVSSAFIYAGGVFLCRRSPDEEKIMRRHVAVIFALYILLLVNFTFFDGSFGRNGSILSSASFSEYFRMRGNVVPFRMIYRQTKALIAGNYSLKNYLVNIAGNVAAFAPFAVFLPLLFKKCAKLRHFLPVVTLIIFSVEAIQIALRVGSFDVDDYILNISGALILFALLSTKTGKKITRRILRPHGDKNTEIKTEQDMT